MLTITDAHDRRRHGAVSRPDVSSSKTADSPLRDEIERLVRDGHVKLVLDLAAVSYIDSAGLGLLVAKFVSLRSRGGDLRLVHPTPRSMHLMTITNLATVFETHPTEDAAVRSFESH